MHFTIDCGLSFMLLFLAVQGELKCKNTNLNVRDVRLPCCMTPSEYDTQETANTCFKQEEDTGLGCEADPKNVVLSTPGPVLNCCTEVSMKPIKEPIKACFVQKNLETVCNIDAYIFVVEKTFCIDPKAPWIQQRIKELESEGIYCKDLIQPQ